jgi:signal transduction histidine kinase
VAVAGVAAGEGGVVYTFRDVTADHTLEQLRGDVVAVVSHELRTPLTAVYGSAQTLLARYDELDADTRRQLLELVVGEAERLTRIVDQILVAGRLDAAEIDLGVQPLRASEILATACAALPAADRGRIVPLGEGDALVRADEAAARQILGSLIDNAIKYSDGPVTVELERIRGAVRFTVADRGPGIPHGERGRIFEKFYRLDPEQRGGVGGVGLGLYIARQLTERLGGRIGVLPVERGTAVFFDLPAPPDP